MIETLALHKWALDRLEFHLRMSPVNFKPVGTIDFDDNVSVALWLRDGYVKGEWFNRVTNQIIGVTNVNSILGQHHLVYGMVDHYAVVVEKGV